MMRWLIFISLFVTIAPAFSQTIPLVDLKLTITADPPFPWRIGQVGTVSMNVTNLSKTQGTIALIQLIPAVPPNVQPTDGFESISASCLGNSECAQFGQMCSETPPINPGATVSCVFTLKAIISRNRPSRSRRYAYTNQFQYNFIDPDLSNNYAQIELAILPDNIAVPLAPLSYLVMLILIGGIGVFGVRGRS